MLNSYADMIIYTIGPATLVPTMCHCKLPKAIVTSLTLSNFDSSFSLAKMHAACSHLAHSVLHSPTIQFSYSTAKKGAAVKLSSCSAFVSELETGCKSLSLTDNQWEMTSLRVYIYACRGLFLEI